MSKIVDLARQRDLVSDDHFSVDGTFIQAWASKKNFRRKDGNDNNSNSGGHNAERDFHGEKHSNETHGSKVDLDARNYKKSKYSEAKLTYLGHSLIENRSGLVVNTKVSLANGYGERDTAIDRLAELPSEHRKTVAADKNHDTLGFVARGQGMNVTPHVAQNIHRKGGSAIDGCTTRHEGYAISTKNVSEWKNPSAGARPSVIFNRLRCEDSRESMLSRR